MDTLTAILFLVLITSIVFISMMVMDLLNILMLKNVRLRRLADKCYLICLVSGILLGTCVLCATQYPLVGTIYEEYLEDKKE